MIIDIILLSAAIQILLRYQDFFKDNEFIA